MKECKKALFLLSNEKHLNELNVFFKRSTSVSAELKLVNGKEGLNTIISDYKNYDIIVMDLILEGLDCTSILQELNKQQIHPRIILISEYIIGSLKRIPYIYNNIEEILINPLDITIVEQLILNVLNHKEEKFIYSDLEIQSQISKHLHELGIPSHIKGYQYVREGIFQLFSNPDKSYKITKDLYPLIAKMYNTTPSRVERAIRHSIEVSWNRGDYNVMNQIFGHSVDYDKAKPTNSEFIASVADAITTEYRINRAKQLQRINYN